MSFDPSPFKPLEADRNVRFAAGLASPLWATFFAAAGAGVAFWWATAGVRRTLASTPVFAGTETRSFSPVPAEAAPVEAAKIPSGEVESALANDIAPAAPETVLEHAEPETAPLSFAPADLPVSEAPVAAPEAVLDHSLADSPEPEVALVAAEDALAETQGEVARLAAEAATAELAPKPRKNRKG